MEKTKKEILVIGAGVTGLTSAITLLKAGHRVSVWAKEFTPNTTSDVAAAIWFPYLCYPRDKATIWSGKTLKYLEKEMREFPDSGCRKQTVIEIFKETVGEAWWKDAVELYRRPKKGELPEGYVDAYIVDAILTDTSRYMPFLMKRVKDLGGTFEQKEVKDFDEAFTKTGIVVNCTGLGSRELCKDESVYPVRGQVVKVKQRGMTTVYADDTKAETLTYVIPRFDDIVLGGTAQANDWDLNVRDEDTKNILKRVETVVPGFSEKDIITIKVGLRPARPSIRLETEEYKPGMFVVHNYGHGGAGYTLAWGCAEEVKDLVTAI